MPDGHTLHCVTKELQNHSGNRANVTDVAWSVDNDCSFCYTLYILLLFVTGHVLITITTLLCFCCIVGDI